MPTLLLWRDEQLLWRDERPCTGFTSTQVTSVIDRSTNYCNLYNLYCGENVGCQVAQTALTAIPLDKKTSLGAGSNKFKCRSGRKKREL